MIMPSVASSQVTSDSKPVSSGSSSITTTTTVAPSNMSLSNGNSTATTGVECAGCGSSILDRFYLSAVDRHWHVSCLKCSQCKVNLQAEPSCFSRDGLIFCKADYYRLFTMRRCSRCGEGIYASELVMRVRDQNVYHIQCFTCAWCNVTLSQGDLFGIRDNLVYCRTHYEMLCSTTPTTFNAGPSSMVCSLGASPPTTEATFLAQPHHSPHAHPHHHHHPHSHHPNLQSSSSSPLLNESIDTCSTMAATPYTSSGIYSPLSIVGGLSSTPVANSGQSPTTPQSIRKGRPRKRKAVEPPSDSMLSSSGSCAHEVTSLSPSVRSSQSPGLGGMCAQFGNEPTFIDSVAVRLGSLDGGPLSGLAASIENSCSSQLSSSALGSLASHQNNQRTKRMRTSFKHHQLRTMKTYFSVNQNPDAKDLKQLAQKTGLSKRVLQVWFQNARAKWRRNNLKMMPDGQELSLNGQTMLMGHPSTPSTVIGSPGGSTRPFSSPSPGLSPSGETSSLSHQPSMSQSLTGPLSQSSLSMHSQQPSGLDTFVSARPEQSLMPLNFQELY